MTLTIIPVAICAICGREFVGYAVIRRRTRHMKRTHPQEIKRY